MTPSMGARLGGLVQDGLYIQPYTSNYCIIPLPTGSSYW